MEKNNCKIKYLTSFSHELNRIMYYITYNLQNPEAANNLLNQIYKSILDRSTSPESYEKYKSKRNRNFTWYRIYVSNYIIFYSVINNTMQIAHILYSKRNFEELI